MFRLLVAVLAMLTVAAFMPSFRVVRQSALQMALNRKATAAIMSGILAFAPAVFAADLEAGSQVFAGNCAACHAGGNNVIQNEKTLRKEALEQYLEGGLKVESIVYQVTNGKNAMPAFGGRLDEDEIGNVAAYVFDQASGGKWD